MTVPEPGVFCVDCDQPATHQRPTDDPDVVELVCHRHQYDGYITRIAAGWQPIDGYWWHRTGTTWEHQPMTDPELATHRHLEESHLEST